jgi:hypothetical protein
MTGVKGFFASKLNWLGIIQVLIGTLEMVPEQDFNDPSAWTFVATGVLTLILRTFFTETKVIVGGGK